MDKIVQPFEGPYEKHAVRSGKLYPRRRNMTTLMEGVGGWGVTVHEPPDL